MKNEHKFQLTILNQIKMLSYTIVMIILFFVIWLYYLNYKLSGAGFFIAFGFLFLFGILPVIILHIQYLIINRSSFFYIDTEKQIGKYKSNKENIIFSFDDIVEITKYNSYGGNTGWYSFSNYSYCRITLSNSTNIFITCLLINDLENMLDSILKFKYEKEYRFICFINAKY